MLILGVHPRLPQYRSDLGAQTLWCFWYGHLCVLIFIHLFYLPPTPQKKKERKESGEMYPVSIVISGLHGLLYYSFQLLVLNLSVDKYIFGLLSSAKWMPLTATMRLMECNSVICSLGGFSVIDVWFQIFRIFVCFLWIVPVCCVKMINKVNY